MFTENIYTIISNGVVTIRGKDIIPKGSVTVSWSCNYYEGQLHTSKLNNLLYHQSA